MTEIQELFLKLDKESQEKFKAIFRDLVQKFKSNELNKDNLAEYFNQRAKAEFLHRRS